MVGISYRIDELIASGSRGRIYSLKPPHSNYVVKIDNHVAKEKKMYEIMMQQHKHVYNQDHERHFCHYIQTSQRDALLLSRCDAKPHVMTRSHIRKCILDITCALNYLHRIHILHNDVHLQNIMMKHNRYVLIDFGMASYRHKGPLDSLYYQLKEDHLALGLVFLYHLYPHVKVHENDFRAHRKHWCECVHPSHPLIKIFHSIFPKTYESWVKEFVHDILSRKKIIMKPNGRQVERLHQFITVALYRFHFLFCIHVIINESHRSLFTPIVKALQQWSE